MELTLKHYDLKHSTDMPDDSVLSDVMEHLINLVKSAGFAPDSIKEWIMQEADEYERDNLQE